MKIPWIYCECGCHQLECKIGYRSFSVFIGFTEYGPYKEMKVAGCHLYEPSHGYDKVNTFASMKEVDKFLEPVVAEQRKVMSDEAKRLKKLSSKAINKRKRT